MGLFQIVGIVADMHGNAHGAQPFDIGIFGRVAALNLVAQIVHDLGDGWNYSSSLQYSRYL